MKKNSNPFAGKKVVNFKGTMLYPNSGNVRFNIQLDKNNQIVDLHYSIREAIKGEKKITYKITLGDRPQKLFEHVKGRPFVFAQPWIDDFILNSIELNS